jgi:hypothetical protein
VTIKLVASPVVEAKAKDTEGARYEVKIIDAGQGSSGLYPAAVLKDAVENKIFAKGLHVYLDHPGMEETWDRPERTVKDLAAVLDDDATWDETNQAVMGSMTVVEHMRPMVKAIWPHVGMSIRAWAESDMQEIDGQFHDVITKLSAAESVDIVTHAGRGGAIVKALESAGIKGFPASPVREKKEVVMPEQISEATASRLTDAMTGLTAALATEAKDRAERQAAAEKAAEVNPLDVATGLGKALAESKLSPVQYDRVVALIKGGVDVAEAIKAEEEYADAIRKEAGAAPQLGQVHTQESSTGARVTVSEAEQSAWDGLIKNWGSRAGELA